jgi:hypothetical protein
MYPSYPSHSRHTDLSVRFSVPNQRIVERILEDSLNDENLKLKAAANVLFPHIDCLSRLMSRHRIQVETISHNQLGVTLFLPPPPCPPPRSNIFSRLKRMVSCGPSLDAVIKSTFDEDESSPAESEWITLYRYVPVDRQFTA